MFSKKENNIKIWQWTNWWTVKTNNLVKNWQKWQTHENDVNEEHDVIYEEDESNEHDEHYDNAKNSENAMEDDECCKQTT